MEKEEYKRKTSNFFIYGRKHFVFVKCRLICRIKGRKGDVGKTETKRRNALSWSALFSAGTLKPKYALQKYYHTHDPTHQHALFKHILL